MRLARTLLAIAAVLFAVGCGGAPTAEIVSQAVVVRVAAGQLRTRSFVLGVSRDNGRA